MVALPDLRCAVVLAANPDGALLGTRGNAAGVDLNRNFPASDWEGRTTRSRWSSETQQVVELSTGSAAGSEPETAALVGLVERLSPRWVVSLHAPIGAIVEPEPTPLGDALVRETGLPRMTAVRYRTSGLLDLWASERGLTCVTLELPRISHDAMSCASPRCSPRCSAARRSPPGPCAGRPAPLAARRALAGAALRRARPRPRCRR